MYIFFNEVTNPILLTHRPTCRPTHPRHSTDAEGKGMKYRKHAYHRVLKLNAGKKSSLENCG